MKIHSQAPNINLNEQTKKIEIKSSNVSNNSALYANEHNIQKLDQKNIVDDYFKTFDKSRTEVEIKNLIAARLQPSYQLPQVHDMQLLSSKAKELLNFSLAI